MVYRLTISCACCSATSRIIGCQINACRITATACNAHAPVHCCFSKPPRNDAGSGTSPLICAPEKSMPGCCKTLLQLSRQHCLRMRGASWQLHHRRGTSCWQCHDEGGQCNMRWYITCVLHSIAAPFLASCAAATCDKVPWRTAVQLAQQRAAGRASRWKRSSRRRFLSVSASCACKSWPFIAAVQCSPCSTCKGHHRLFTSLYPLGGCCYLGQLGSLQLVRWSCST